MSGSLGRICQPSELVQGKASVGGVRSNGPEEVLAISGNAQVDASRVGKL